jgi:hypothetical protein
MTGRPRGHPVSTQARGDMLDSRSWCAATERFDEDDERILGRHTDSPRRQLRGEVFELVTDGDDIGASLFAHFPNRLAAPASIRKDDAWNAFGSLLEVAGHCPCGAARDHALHLRIQLSRLCRRAKEGNLVVRGTFAPLLAR